MQRPTTPLGMHHVALFVRDMARACQFYIDLLGYHVEWQPDADNVYLTCGKDNLALHRCPSSAPFHTLQRLDHIGILVQTPQAVHAYEAFLRQHDVTILATTRQHRDGATSCMVADPDGLAVQILHHPPLMAPLAVPLGG